MNATEKKYLLERIRRITWDKERELNKKFTVGPKTLTPTDFLKLVKSGKIKLHKDCEEVYWTLDISKVFNLSKYVHRYSETDDEALEQAQEGLKLQRTALEDNIMLGEASKALELLQAFEKEPV